METALLKATHFFLDRKYSRIFGALNFYLPLSFDMGCYLLFKGIILMVCMITLSGYQSLLVECVPSSSWLVLTHKIQLENCLLLGACLDWALPAGFEPQHTPIDPGEQSHLYVLTPAHSSVPAIHCIPGYQVLL